MATEVAIDNDVLHKLACYELLSEAHKALTAGSPTLGVLGAAKFVVAKLLARGASEAESKQLVAFKEFLGLVELLEPTDDEIALAVELEEEALRLGLEVDSGESQLLAMAQSRDFRLLVTGDKRAIAGAEVARSTIVWLQDLDRRIACLEQIMMVLLDCVAIDDLRRRVCAAASVDKAVRACFGCASDETAKADIHAALASYVAHLRQAAPSLLASDLLQSS